MTSDDRPAHLRDAPPARRDFEHPDGRRWSAAIENEQLRIEMVFPDDDDPIVREYPHPDWRAAAEARDALCAEQLEEGFVELTAWRPAQPSALSEAVSGWREVDPEFDPTPWTDAIEPHREILDESVSNLRLVWVDRGDGTAVGDEAATRENLARSEEVWARLPPEAVEAALVLALRAKPHGIARSAIAALRGRATERALPALVSCMRRFAPSSNDLPGSVSELVHPSRFPTLSTRIVDDLIEMLDHEAWESRTSALGTLRWWADDRRIFAACWAKRDDPELRVSLVHACAHGGGIETLEWLEAQRKAKVGRGWAGTVDWAIESVKTRAKPHP